MKINLHKNKIYHSGNVGGLGGQVGEQVAVFHLPEEIKKQTEKKIKVKQQKNLN